MDYSKGDRIVTTAPVREPRIGGDSYYGPTMMGVAEGSTGTVTRVGTNSVLVRFDMDENGSPLDPFSIWVNQERLAIDGSVPRKRRLGEKPEGDDLLDPNDPRLAWFWDDVSAYAAKSSYCSMFDQILKELHLPPRKQQYVARGTLGDGIDVTANIIARSQKEANDMLAERLAERIKEATT